MTAPMAGFGPMAWSPLSGAGGGGTPPVVNTTTTTFEGGPWTFTRDAGAAEDIITFSVADDAASYFRLRNATALATQFAPEIVSLSDNSLPGLSLSVQTNNDVGVQPAVLLTTYVSGTIRPLLQFYNSGGTPLVEVDGLGTWNFVKPAETGVAETITQWGVADSALRFKLVNLPTADTEFVPCFVWPNNGAGAPTFTTRSTGTRSVYRDTIDASTVDFAIGYTTDTQWYSVGKPTSTYKHSFYGGEAEIAFTRGDGIQWVRRVTDETVLGDSRILVLRDVSGLNNSRYEIGLGYHSLTDPDGNYQPVVIGHRITDGAGGTKGNFYIATRDVTTNTAPTERVEVTAAGLVGIGGTPEAKMDIIGSSNVSSAQQAIRFTDTGSTAAQRNWALGNSIGANYGEFCFYASAAKGGNPLSGGVLSLTLKSDGSADVAGTIRATGRAAPTTGAGVEIDYSGGVGRVLSYDRTGAAYTPLDLEASLFTFYAGGVEKLNVSSTAMTMAVPIGLVSYTVATLPVATATRFIYVSDESGGAVPAFADGTNWRRVTDRAIVS